MSKRTATVTAAWIAGALALVGTVIGVIANLSNKHNVPPVEVVASGDASTAVVIGGDLRNSQVVVNPHPPQEGLTKEVETIASQVIDLMDAIPPNMPELAGQNSVISRINEGLARDPYNVRALLIRGQAFYTDALAFGGQGMRQALADFQKVASIDNTLADAHFGIGTVLYHLGFFDLAQRGRYKVHEKGGLRLNKATGMLEMRSPRLEFFPDGRNRIIFQAALEEFEMGQKLAQLYTQTGDTTMYFFAPSDIEKRVRSVRQFLGHEPSMEPDDQLIMSFTASLRKIEPKGFDLLFEIDRDSQK